MATYSINSYRAITLLDLVDENGYKKTYSGLTNSNDISFVNGLSHSSSVQIWKTSGLINYNYYHGNGTFSYSY